MVLLSRRSCAHSATKREVGFLDQESIVAAYRRAKHKIWKTKGNDQTHYQNLSIQDDFADTV